MKREINLRTREFTISREFYWPRVFTALIVVLVGVVLAGGTFFVYLHGFNLRTRLARMETEKAALEARVAPVLQMEAEIRVLRERANIDRRFVVLSWSSHLLDLEWSAAAGGVRIDLVACSDGSRVSIRGSGPSMRAITLFVQELEQLEFLSGVRYTVMSTKQDEGYSYDIVANINGGGS